MKDLISVIVPIYNVEKYLAECIESIIKQTYKNLEIILINDGSTDSSCEICNEYKEKDNRNKVINKKNEGVSSARNTGIDVSKGSYLTFVDSDDWIEDNFVEILYNKAKEKNADVVLCGYNRIIGNSQDSINFVKKEYEFASEEYLINTLNPQTGFGFCHMKLFEKKCIRSVRFKEDLKVGEDALFNEEISANIKKAIFIEKNLYNYRINANSVVRKFDVNYVEKYQKAMTESKKYILENFEKNQIVRQNYYNYVAYHVLLIAVNYCFHPNSQNGKCKLRDVCNINEFKECIKKCNYENLSLTRKITLFTIKYKMYDVTKIICKIRQKQNNTNKT